MNRIEFVQRFAENLEIERTRIGMSQKEMADALDISLSTYKRMVNCDIEKIDLYTAYRLYQITGKLAYEFLDLSDPYLDLKKKIKNLSPAQLSYITGLVDFEKQFAKEHEDVDDFITVYVPTGNMEDGMRYDSANVEKLNIASYRKRYGSVLSCGIKITSNHLHPTYNLDDILLISRSPIRHGDTGVFINTDNGCAYIRKFYQSQPCRLEPVCDYGETFYVDSASKADMDKWIKFGYVVTKIR